MNKIIFLILSIVCFSFTKVMSVNEVGYETVNEIVLSVNVTPVVVIPSTNVEKVQIFPQTSGVTDVWYAMGTSANLVTLWKPVGSYYTEDDNLKEVRSTLVAIDGLVLKKTSGEAKVGIVFLKRSNYIY